MSAPQAGRETSAGHPQTRARAVHFGLTVRRRRKARGWTQDKLAEAAGWDRHSIVRIEGAKFSPSLHRLLQLADALGEPLDVLLADAREEQALAEQGGAA